MDIKCHNPSLGLATKTRACKGVSQVWRPRVTSHALKSVGECEGMNPHTPKWAPTLGVRVPTDSQILESNCKGQKLLDWSITYIMRKLLERRCLKWACMTHLDISNTSYAQKKGRESNCQIWLSTTKSWELPQFLYVQVTCNITLESFWQRAITLLQTSSRSKVYTQCYGPSELWESQFWNFGTPIWESREKMTFGC
jgi:hypothetical protein